MFRGQERRAPGQGRTSTQGAARRRSHPLAVAGRTVAALAVAVLVGTAVGAAPASAADEKKTPTPTELAARTYPGVQLIQVDYAAELTVPLPRLDEPALNRLLVRLRLQLLSGTIDFTKAALLQAMVDELEKNPLAYFKPTSSVDRATGKLTGVGTGWVVTPDGYVVTAAHVVAPDAAELKQQFAATGLAEFNRRAAEDIARSNSGANGFVYTSKEIGQLTKALGVFNAKYLKVGKISKKVSAQLGVAVAGFGKGVKGKPAEIVSVGEPYPGKDVAILKLEGESNMPTVPLGQNTDVKQGEPLFVAGYPAASTFYSGLSKDSEVQPTVTTGPLTAIKSAESGMPVFQTQAPASPGNSGGPVLDAQGDAVGVLVASAVDDKGVALENQEFVIPVSVVREALQQKNITPTSSQVTTTYNRALTEFYAKHYKRSLPLFQQVRNLYGGHPYVDKFIADSQTAIDNGLDETPAPTWVWFLLAGGVLVVLLLVAGLVLLLRRRGRRKAAASSAQPAPQYAFAGAPPPAGAAYPQQGYPAAGYPQQGYGQPQGYPQQPYAQPGQTPQGYPPAGLPAAALRATRRRPAARRLAGARGPAAGLAGAGPAGPGVAAARTAGPGGAAAPGGTAAAGGTGVAASGRPAPGRPADPGRRALTRAGLHDTA